MAVFRAYLHNLRMSPRKVRLVGSLVKGMPVERAEVELEFLSKKATLPLLKLLRSAKANALHMGFSEDGLKIKEVRVDEGNAFRRFRKQAPGGIKRITKRSSHVLLTLETGSEKRTRRLLQREKPAPDRDDEHHEYEKTETKPKPSLEKTPVKPVQPKRPNFVQRVFRRKAI